MWCTSRATPWLAAMAVAAAPGCGGDSTGPGGGNVAAGRFTATITGGVSQTLSGISFYSQAEDGLAIAMSSDDEGSAGGLGVVLARGNSALPAVGSYPVKAQGEALPVEDFIVISFWGSSSSLILCESGDVNDPNAPSLGSVDITTSGSSLAGDFSTVVGCLDPNTGAVNAATITGEFNATAGPAD